MHTFSRVTCSLLLVLTASACAADPAPGDDAEEEPSLVGSWRLESWTVAGTPRCSAEEGRGSGQIMYSSDGHMSAQLGCGDRSLDELEDADTEEVVARLLRRHFSYYGTYTVDVDAGTVTHHVQGSSSPAWVGTERVRSFVFEGPDRIRLSTMESDNELVWVRN